MNRFIYALTVVGIFSAQTAIAQATETVVPFRQEGIASWYGSEFDGKATASGEIFDSKQLTAAHPSLPFGTTLRVTNTQNGKMTIVRVNDRGPFVAARIIDVSRAAAEKIDMLSTGTAPVVIETATAPAPQQATPHEIEKEPAAKPIAQAASETSGQGTPLTNQDRQNPAPSAAEAKADTPSAKILPAPVDPTKNKRYRLQVGSYKAPKYAAEAFDKLRKEGLAPAYEKNGDNYRVVIPEAAAAEVEALARIIGKAGFKEVLAREIP